MNRWKSTANILKDDNEVFDENWMDRDIVQRPPSVPWLLKRPPRVDEIDVWEIIVERGGPTGVYAAWCPHAEFYIVASRGRIMEEFSGWQANARLEAYLRQSGVDYPWEPDRVVPAFEPSSGLIVVGR